MTPERGVWKVWIDTGGTFTDCLAEDPDGRRRRAKVLSSGALRVRVAEVAGSNRLRLEPPGDLPPRFLDGARVVRACGGREVGRVARLDGERGELELTEQAAGVVEPGEGLEIVTGEPAPVLAARRVTGTPRGAALPPIDLRLGTTRGTNALLERKGAPTALFITRGLGDLLEIGTQQRPELFALAVVKPPPLAARVVEVDERLAADGRVLRELDLAELEETIAGLLEEGVTAAAVALLHSYRNPEPERRLGRHLAARGFRQVSCSADLVAQIRLLPRAETAVADAYLGAVVGQYLEQVGRGVGARRFHVMTSSGGLHRADEFRPKDSLLSGPAGGVVGAAATARRERIVAFDMGGTSTDVSRCDGELDYRFETRVGGVRLLAPAVAIETVAAGGGSVCRYEAGRLRVGPESSGADPGPACYGGGGPLCVTDVNLLLGRLWAPRFGLPLDREAAEAAADRLLRPVGGAREETLAGLLRIADERMAEAVRQISVQRGYDPGEYALVAFGGAGPQHACSLAGLLGMAEIVVPADASLLSALGLGAARLERFAQRQVLRPLGEVADRLEGWIRELAEEASRAVAAEGVPRPEIEVRLRRAELRLLGQDASLAVEYRGADLLAAAFEERYRRRYGYAPPRREIEVDLLRVAASSRSRPVGAGEAMAASDGAGEAAADRTRCWFDAGWRETEVRSRSALGPGAVVAGPALVVEPHTCTVVEPGWSARVEGDGNLRLGRCGGGDD